MAYSDFTLDILEEQFGLSNKLVDIFPSNIALFQTSDWFKETLKKSKDLPLRTEKARSELLVMPLLLELRHQNIEFINLYSGEVLNANKEKGLYGECDFIITRNTQSFDLNLPLLTLVEAKNHDINIGIAQCSAQMLGGQVFNKKHKVELPVIYGCVTTGNEWNFLKLEEKIIYIDKNIYFFNEIEKVLSLFQYIIDLYKSFFKTNTKNN